MSPAKSRKPSPQKQKRPSTKRSTNKGRKAAAKLFTPKPAAPAENPRAKELAQQIASFVLDKKALDVVVLDVRGMTSYADYFVVASGESERQVSAMAENVLVRMKEQGQTTIGFEGFETGRWVLLDYGEVVVHLFFQEVREFYDLEGLWADAPREKVA